MTDCIFCKIINGEIPTTFIYQDEQIVAFKDIHPKAEVHILVVPKQHIRSLAEVTPNQAALISQLLLTLPLIAKAIGLNNGFRTIINTGVAGGQEIWHLHAHLLGGKKLVGF